MADAARMVEAAGADIVDVNFGCPVKKVTRTGAGATCSRTRIAHAGSRAIADAVDVPVTVKLRRGVQNGSRAASSSARGSSRSAPRHSRCILAPRADVHGHGRSRAHGRARLARRRPGGRLRRHHLARPRPDVLATTGAAAVMVGRGAQGNPWALREIVEGDAESRRARRWPRSSSCSFARRCASWESGAPRVPEEVLRLVPRPGPLSEAVQAGAPPARLTEEVERRLFAAAPGASSSSSSSRRSPDGDEVTLELPSRSTAEARTLGVSPRPSRRTPCQTPRPM